MKLLLLRTLIASIMRRARSVAGLRCRATRRRKLNVPAYNYINYELRDITFSFWSNYFFRIAHLFCQYCPSFKNESNTFVGLAFLELNVHDLQSRSSLSLNILQLIPRHLTYTPAAVYRTLFVQPVVLLIYRLSVGGNA